MDVRNNKKLKLPSYTKSTTNPRMTTLRISRKYLTRDDISILCTMSLFSKLQVLDLGNVQLSGDFGETFGRLFRSLKHLKILIALGTSATYESSTITAPKGRSIIIVGRHGIVFKVPESDLE